MRVNIRVRFGNGKPEIKDGILVVYTSAKPENNRANIDVIKQVAKYYGRKAGEIRLIEGRRSRNKTFLVEE